MTKPKIESVPLAVGLAWRSGGYLYQEKSDGRHEFLTVGDAVLNAERMKDGSLIVNDIVSREPTRIRWAMLAEYFKYFKLSNTTARLCRVGSGGEFLEHLLREGGEGVVAKPLDAPFGLGWLKCKRCQVFKCRVGDLDHYTGAAVLFDAATGQPRGRVALRSRFEDVRVGSVLKVEAYGLTDKGMLREARLDKDTPSSWLVAY